MTDSLPNGNGWRRRPPQSVGSMVGLATLAVILLTSIASGAWWAGGLDKNGADTVKTVDHFVTDTSARMDRLERDMNARMDRLERISEAFQSDIRTRFDTLQQQVTAAQTAILLAATGKANAPVRR